MLAGDDRQKGGGDDIAKTEQAIGGDQCPGRPHGLRRACRVGLCRGCFGRMAQRAPEQRHHPGAGQTEADPARRRTHPEGLQSSHHHAARHDADAGAGEHQCFEQRMRHRCGYATHAPGDAVHHQHRRRDACQQAPGQPRHHAMGKSHARGGQRNRHQSPAQHLPLRQGHHGAQQGPGQIADIVHRGQPAAPDQTQPGIGLHDRQQRREQKPADADADGEHGHAGQGIAQRGVHGGVHRGIAECSGSAACRAADRRRNPLVGPLIARAESRCTRVDHAPRTACWYRANASGSSIDP